MIFSPPFCSNIFLVIFCIWPFSFQLFGASDTVESRFTFCVLCDLPIVLTTHGTLLTHNYLRLSVNYSRHKYFDIFSSDRSSYSGSMLLYRSAGYFLRFWVFLPIFDHFCLYIANFFQWSVLSMILSNTFWKHLADISAPYWGHLGDTLKTCWG